MLIVLIFIILLFISEILHGVTLQHLSHLCVLLGRHTGSGAGNGGLVGIAEWYCHVLSFNFETVKSEIMPVSWLQNSGNCAVFQLLCTLSTLSSLQVLRMCRHDGVNTVAAKHIKQRLWLSCVIVRRWILSPTVIQCYLRILNFSTLPCFYTALSDRNGIGIQSVK